MKTNSRFLLAAALGLAMAFTFSCSSGDDKEPGDSSSPSGGNTQGGCPNATTGNGTLSCGGQTYKIVVIGSQTWMAQNLNYAIGESKCYGDSEANCTTYGRLYDWNTARLACPSDWHLPSFNEWLALADFVGMVELVFGGLTQRAAKPVTLGTWKWTKMKMELVVVIPISLPLIQYVA